jgi:DNA-binding MarR family transcriptional regulator
MKNRNGLADVPSGTRRDYLHPAASSHAEEHRAVGAPTDLWPPAPTMPRVPNPIPVDVPVPPGVDIEPVFNALRRIVHALHGASRETERRLGVTSAQLFVLTQLRATPSLSINALAERTMTHQSTVSVVVRRLVRRKLVKKVRAAADARRVELTLTPSGVALLRRAPEVMQVRLARAIAHMDESHREALALGLGQLGRELGVDDAPVAMFFETSP